MRTLLQLALRELSACLMEFCKDMLLTGATARMHMQVVSKEAKIMQNPATERLLVLTCLFHGAPFNPIYYTSGSMK